MYVQRWAFVYLVNIESCDFNLRRLVAEDLELLRTIGYDYGLALKRPKTKLLKY